MTLISEEVFSEPENPFHYFDLSRNHLTFTPNYAFDADPTGFTSDTPATSLQITLNKDHLSTDLPFKTTETPLPLRDADLSVNLASNPDAIGMIQALLAELPHTGIDLEGLSIPPTQISVTFDQDHRSTQTLLTFDASLSQAQKQQLLASLGLTGRRSLRLADGSIATEQTALETETSTSTHYLTKFGPVEILDRDVQLGTSTHPLQEISSSCQGAKGWLRLSPEAVRLLLKSVGVITDSTSLPALSIGSQEGKMEICLER